MSREDAVADRVRIDYRQAPISARERTMLDYVVKLTKTPSQMEENDVRNLRAVGFDELAVLHIVLLSSWFNYITRVAEGLGIELDEYIWNKVIEHEEIPWAEQSASHPPVGK